MAYTHACDFAVGTGLLPPPGGVMGGMAIAPTPGMRPGDESFGVLTSRRPRTHRSTTFAQISALAAVTKQEAKFEDPRYAHAMIV